MNAFHEKAIDVAVTGRNDTSRINAAVAMLNRGWGAPKRTVYVEYTQAGLSSLLSAPGAHNTAKTLLPGKDGPLATKGISEAESLAATGDQQKN